jgi:hypothetical protein
MSFDSEFQDAEKQVIEQKSKYMSSPRVAQVEVTKCVLSEDVAKDYKGCPYMEVEFKDKATEELNTSKFFRTRDTDSEDVRGYKLKGIKEFFMNAGIDMKVSGSKALVEVVGKEIKALFRAEEYVGYDKNQLNMPVIKESIRYLYSGPVGEELTGKSNYMRKILKADEKAKFDAEMATWNRDNMPKPVGAGAVAPKAEALGDENDDLPF